MQFAHEQKRESTTDRVHVPYHNSVFGAANGLFQVYVVKVEQHVLIFWRGDDPATPCGDGVVLGVLRRLEGLGTGGGLEGAASTGV